MTSLTYIVDRGPGTEWMFLRESEEDLRVIGIQIGPVPRFRSVRGRGVTRIMHCGHPSRFGLCALAPGHPGAHVYGGTRDHSAFSPQEVGTMRHAENPQSGLVNRSYAANAPL